MMFEYYFENLSTTFSMKYNNTILSGLYIIYNKIKIFLVRFLVGLLEYQ